MVQDLLNWKLRIGEIVPGYGNTKISKNHSSLIPTDRFVARVVRGRRCALQTKDIEICRKEVLKKDCENVEEVSGTCCSVALVHRCAAPPSSFLHPSFHQHALPLTPSPNPAEQNTQRVTTASGLRERFQNHQKKAAPALCGCGLLFVD
jgi:hypothetical protein